MLLQKFANIIYYWHW